MSFARLDALTTTRGCKIHELGQCLTVRFITDVPGHDQTGLASLVPGRPLHFRQPEIDRVGEYCGKRKSSNLPAVHWSLNEEKWRVKFVLQEQVSSMVKKIKFQAFAEIRFL